MSDDSGDKGGDESGSSSDDDSDEDGMSAQAIKDSLQRSEVRFDLFELGGGRC